MGTLTTGFTVLPCFPIVRVYRAEQLSISLRGRRHFAGQWFARAFAGVVVPFLQLYLRVDLKNRKTWSSIQIEIGFGRYAGWPDINECTGGDCNAHLALSAVPGPTTNAKAMIAPDMGEEQPVATKQPGVGTGKTSGAFVRTPASSRQTAVPR